MSMSFMVSFSAFDKWSYGKWEVFFPIWYWSLLWVITDHFPDIDSHQKWCHRAYSTINICLVDGIIWLMRFFYEFCWSNKKVVRCLWLMIKGFEEHIKTCPLITTVVCNLYGLIKYNRGALFIHSIMAPMFIMHLSDLFLQWLMMILIMSSLKWRCCFVDDQRYFCELLLLYQGDLC